MRRRGMAQPTDDDGLQTDVMRFMAIIAFCLVAVLALVREASDEVVETPVAKKTPVAHKEPVADKTPVPEPPAIEAPPVEKAPDPEPKPEPEPVVPEPAPRMKPQLVVVPPAPKATVEAPPMEVVEPVAARAEPEADTEPQPNPEPEPEAVAETQTEAEDEGLTLRFASDADFIDLIRRGKVRVYAYNDDTFFVLDRGFTFRPAQPPKSLHDLQTVPKRIEFALPSNLTAPRWGVRLPVNTTHQIEQLVRSQTSGQLVIHRTGAVQHVAS